MTEFARNIWYWFARYILVIFPDTVFINTIFLINCIRLRRPYYILSLKYPQTFTEKINWLKLRTKIEDGRRLADKYEVRKFVEDRIGSQFLIPLIGVYKSSNEIEFEKLPEKFVLKATHGSGWNIRCRDKSKLKTNKVKVKLDEWLARNPYYLSREWQYDVSNARIICEYYLGDNIKDYKFFCFDGEVKYVQVDIDRFTKHKRNIYSKEWSLLSIEINYPRYDGVISPPARLDEMISLAEQLSKGLMFSRIDLYWYNEHVYFGEITLFPGGGSEPFDSYNSDLEFGRELVLDK